MSLDDIGEGARWIHSFLSAAFFIVAATAAKLMMAALLVAGLLEIGKGIFLFYGWTQVDLHGLSIEARTLELCLKGLEFLFLAPLGFLVLWSLAKYLNSLNAEEGNEELIIKAKCTLIGVKSLIVGLMIAVVATDLVGRILSREPLSYETAITRTIVILALGAYLLSLEKFAARGEIAGEGDH